MKKQEKKPNNDIMSIISDTFIDLNQIDTKTENTDKVTNIGFCMTQNYKNLVSTASQISGKKKIKTSENIQKPDQMDKESIFQNVSYLSQKIGDIKGMDKVHIDTFNVPYISTPVLPKIYGVEEDVQHSSSKSYSTTYMNFLKSTQNGDTFDNNMNIFRSETNNKIGYFTKKYSTIIISTGLITYSDKPEYFCNSNNRLVTENISNDPEPIKNLKMEICRKLNNLIKLRNSNPKKNDNIKNEMQKISEGILYDTQSLNNHKTMSKYSFILFDQFPVLFPGMGILNNVKGIDISDENTKHRLYDFVIFHTLFSSKQRSTLFEKSLGHVDPMVIMSPITKLSTKFGWKGTKIDILNLQGSQEETKIFSTKIWPDVRYSKPYYSEKLWAPLNLHSRYIFFDTIRNLRKDPQYIQEDQLFNSPCFFDFCIQKVCAVIYNDDGETINSVSTIFDYSKMNSCLLEHCISKFCQYNVKKWIHQMSENGKTLKDMPKINFFIALKPSIYLSALGFKLLNKTRNMIYTDENDKHQIYMCDFHMIKTKSYNDIKKDPEHVLKSFSVGDYHKDIETYIPFKILQEFTNIYENFLSTYDTNSERVPLLVEYCLSTLPYIKKMIENVMSNMITIDNKELIEKFEINIGYTKPFIKIINTPLDHKIDRHIQNNDIEKLKNNTFFIKSGIQTLTELSEYITKNNLKQTQYSGLNQKRQIYSIPDIKSEFGDYFKYVLRIYPDKYNNKDDTIAFTNGRFIVLEESLGNFSKMIGFQDDFELFDDIYSFENLLLYTPILDKVLKLEDLNLPKSLDDIKKMLYGYINYLDIEINEQTNQNEIRASIIRKIKSLSKEEIGQMLHIITTINETIQSTNYQDVSVEIINMDNVDINDSKKNQITFKTTIGYLENADVNDKTLSKELKIKETELKNGIIGSIQIYLKKTLRIFKFISGIINGNIVNIVNIWKRDFTDFFIIKLKNQTKDDNESNNQNKISKNKKNDSYIEDYVSESNDGGQDDIDIEKIKDSKENIRLDIIKSLISKISKERLSGKFIDYDSDKKGALRFLSDSHNRIITKDAIDRLGTLIKTKNDNFYPEAERKSYFKAVKSLDEDLIKEYIEEIVYSASNENEEQFKNDDNTNQQTSFKQTLFEGFKSFFGYKNKGNDSDLDTEKTTQPQTTKKSKENENLTTTTNQKIDINITTDEIDTLIDICSVCGFFKNYVLLDHGYSNNHKNLFGVGIFEPESCIYAESIWNEIISSNANSNIISPIKGLGENFISDYRISQKSLFSNSPSIYSAHNSISSTLDLLENDIDYNLISDAIETLNIKTNPFLDIQNITKKWDLSEGNISVISEKFIDKTFDKTRDFKSVFMGTDIIEKVNELSNITDIGILKYDGVETNFSSDVNRIKIQNFSNPEYIDGFRSPIERKIGSGIEKINIITTEKYYSELDKMVINVDTMLETGIIDKFCDVIMHHISEGCLFSPNTSNFVDYHYISQFDIPSFTTDITNQDKQFVSKKYGAMVLQNLSCNNYTYDSGMIIDGKNGKNIHNTYVSVIEKILSLFFSSYDSDKSIMNKKWYSSNQGSNPDIVSGDISVSLLCDRIYYINFITLKINSNRHIESDKYDSLLFLNNINIMTSITDTEKFFSSTANLPSDMNRIISDQKVTIIYEKQENKSLKEKMLSEFNIRKNIFEIACLGINGSFKYGATPRSFFNKILWSAYEIEYNNTIKFKTRVPEKSYNPQFSHTLLKLKHNLWSFYENWYSQDIVTPQTFILFSKMRKNISLETKKSNKDIIRDMSKSNMSYFDQKYNIPKTGGDNKWSKGSKNQKNYEPLSVQNMIHESPCDTIKIINIKKSRMLKNILDDYEIDGTDTKMSISMNNLQYNINMNEQEFDKNSQSLKKDFINSERDESYSGTIDLTNIQKKKFVKYAKFLTSHSYGYIEPLYQTTIPSGYDIDSFEHPYQCYSPLLKPKSKIASVIMNENSGRVEVSEFDNYDEEYIIPIFTLGKPNDENVEEIINVANSSFMNQIEYRKFFNHNKNMRVLESNYKTRLSENGFPEYISQKDDISKFNYISNLFQENFNYGYSNNELDNFDKKFKGGIVDIMNGSFSPFMNYGIGIVSIMNVVSCLWLICMTAKLDSLRIYKPMDILKLMTSKWKILSGKKKTFSKKYVNDSDKNSPFGHNEENQVKILTQNPALYDIFEYEFTGVSNLALDDIKTESVVTENEDDDIDNIINESNSDRIFKRNEKKIKKSEFDQNLSETNVSRIKEAIEYIFMLPDLYRQYTGQILSRQEQEFINNSQRSIFRNLEILRETEINDYDDVLNNTKLNNKEFSLNNEILMKIIDEELSSVHRTMSEKIKDDNVENIEDNKFQFITEILRTLISELQKQKSTESISTTTTQIKIVKDELFAQNKQSQNENKSDKLNNDNDESYIDKSSESDNSDYEESDSDQEDIKVDKLKDVEKYNKKIRKRILKKILGHKNLDFDTQIESLENVTKELENYTKKKNQLLNRENDTKGEVHDEYVTTFHKDGVPKIILSHYKEKIDKIKKSSTNNKISVLSILYSCLSRPDGMDNISLDLPYHMDSFNVIYSVIKMMESGGITGNINKRPLDTGSGLTGNVLMNAGPSYFQNLLDESISNKSSPFWECLPSKAYELGIMDSLISNQ